MTNDFKARKNGGIYSMKQKLSPEEYKRFKEEEKSNVYQLIDDIATITVGIVVDEKQIEDIPISDTSFELLSEEDLQIQFNLIQEDKNNEII